MLKVYNINICTHKLVVKQINQEQILNKDSYGACNGQNRMAAWVNGIVETGLSRKEIGKETIYMSYLSDLI